MPQPSNVAPQASGNTPYRSEEARLKQLSRQFIEDYPDVYGLAYAAARKILRQHTNKRLDPRKVWWHRFSSAVSSSRTFSGWMHAGTPVESMTLVELVMHRFHAQDQAAMDEVQSYAGFYTDGPQHWIFDERNEVAMSPGQVLKDFWALNFSAMFQRRVREFWTSHGDTFCTLARTRLLACAAQEVHSGRLSLRDFQIISEHVSARNDSILGTSGYEHAPQAHLRSFDIGGVASPAVMRLVESTGRQIIYLPGETPAFHTFASPRKLYEWLRRRLADDSSRPRLEALFVHPAFSRPKQRATLRQAVEQIRIRPWDSDNPFEDAGTAGLINRDDQAITDDLFQHWQRMAEQEMQSTARSVLTSNGDLRKQLWIGYLTAFIHVLGPTAALAWPLALIMVGAGTGNLGLNIDQAFNGKSAEQRKAGVIGSVLNSIFILFNLPLLLETATSIELLGDESGTTERMSYQALPDSVPEPVPLASNAGEDVRLMQGVQQTASGETWISLAGKAQRVRYSSELRSWIVVDAANPFAFTGANAVRYNADGVWEVLPPLRLNGGSPMQAAGTSASFEGGLPFPTRQSSFWDNYMQPNPTEEEHLCELALARQKEVINVREAQSDDDLSSDSDGEQVLVDAGGSHYRIFKGRDGRYMGGRVRQYTERDEDFNSYLRTGQERLPGQVRLINELGDDLGTIGFNNHVSLYRGGSGTRGTSGLIFRKGQIRAGDILVNTDFTSFSESPYVARSFASSQAGAPSYGFNGNVTFDDTSIIFELPAERYLSATPIAPFAVDEEEAESLFMPGNHFQIQNIQEVKGSGYKFINVQIREVPQPTEGAALYDLRTGEPFDRALYEQKLGPLGKVLVDRFFPLPEEPAPGVTPPHA